MTVDIRVMDRVSMGKSGFDSDSAQTGPGDLAVKRPRREDYH
jgi:hypothetical protein